MHLVTTSLYAKVLKCEIFNCNYISLSWFKDVLLIAREVRQRQLCLPRLLRAAVYTPQHEPQRSWAHLHGDRLSDRTREPGHNGKLPVCCKALHRGASTVHSGFMTAQMCVCHIFVSMMTAVLTVWCVFLRFHSQSERCMWTAWWEVLMLCAG